MVYLYNGILLRILKKEGNPVTRDDIAKPGGYYAICY